MQQLKAVCGQRMRHVKVCFVDRDIDRLTRRQKRLSGLLHANDEMLLTRRLRTRCGYGTISALWRTYSAIQIRQPTGALRSLILDPYSQPVVVIVACRRRYAGVREAPQQPQPRNLRIQHSSLCCVPQRNGGAPRHQTCKPGGEISKAPTATHTFLMVQEAFAGI